MNKIVKIGDKSYNLVSDDDYLNDMGENFEPHMVDLFKCLIKPNDVIIDVGANIGVTSILFSNLAKKVYSFEPSPSTFKILENNLSSLNINNTEVVNLALGEKKGESTITFSENNRSGGFVSDKIKPFGHVTENIKIETLDNFCFQNNVSPNFVKIDTEGFEESVIKGAFNTIKDNKLIVVLELNHFCLNVLHRITVPDFFDFLRSVFPILYAVDNDNSSIVDLHNEEQAYSVMYQHVVNFHYPNIVGGFDLELATTLKRLELLNKPVNNVSTMTFIENKEKNFKKSRHQSYFRKLINRDKIVILHSRFRKPLTKIYHALKLNKIL